MIVRSRQPFRLTARIVYTNDMAKPRPDLGDCLGEPDRPPPYQGVAREERIGMAQSVRTSQWASGPHVGSDLEWSTRVALAALHRAVALNGWDDHTQTHISARVPGEPEHMLLAPLGATFDEVTASSLIKTTLEGDRIESGPGKVNRGGVVIHGGLYRGRPSVSYIAHLHTTADVAVSAQRFGLLPISQYAMVLTGKVAHHDYEGLALETGERERLVEHMAGRPVMLLNNHGSLVCANSVAETFFYIRALERACEVQLAALTAGIDNLILCDTGVSQKTADQLDEETGFYTPTWDAMVRRLDKALPGYDA